MFEWVGKLVEPIVDGIRAVPGVLKRRRQKRILLGMLKQDRYRWRRLSTLAQAIGEAGHEAKVRDLLISIGARAYVREKDQVEVWGLISRVGSSGLASPDEIDNDRLG
jgi:hypothetical protein